MAAQPDLIARLLGATDTELGLGRAPRYRVFIRNGDFERVAELTEWTSLSLVSRFNDVGTWTLETSAETPEIELLTKSGGIIVTREADGVERTIFSGFVWTEWGYTARTFRAAGYSDEALLWTPARPTPGLAGPPFQHEYDVRTGTASTIMRALVALNIGPNAPAPWGISALNPAPDPVLGTTITARANLQPLLTLLAELAITPFAGGLGFYLRQSDVRANEIEFGIYAPPDRSADAKFSIDLGTAAEYEDIAQAPEANHVYVLGGDGLGVSRTIIAEQDDASIAEWGRVISTVIDRRGTDNTGELNQQAAEAIAGVSTLRRTAVVPFDVPSLQFGREYDLGTLVTVVTRGGTVVDLIRQVEIDLDPERGATVTPIVGQGDGSDEERVATITRTIQNRLSNLERNWNVPPDSIDASMLQANAVTTPKIVDGAVTTLKIASGAVHPDRLGVVNAPSDNAVFVYDSASGLGEWVTLAVLAAATTFSTLTASGAITGSRLVSTVANGTAPLSVTSTTKVDNLNANYLEGLGAGDFSAIGHLHDSRYVNADGDTMTGLLTLEPSVATEAALKVKNNSGSGGFTLGATNAADPTLLLKDNSGDLIAEVGNSASAHKLRVLGQLKVELHAVVDNDLTANRVIAGATGYGGTEKLYVNGSGKFGGGIDVDAFSVIRADLSVHGDVTLGNSSGDQHEVNGPITCHQSITCDTGISAAGSSLFSGGVTIQTNDLTFQSGARVNHGSGSASSATISSWDGYVEMKFNGLTKRFYYKD